MEAVLDTNFIISCVKKNIDFIDELERRKVRFEYLKGHVTGPLTFSLSIPDQNKKPIYYDADMLDVIVKAISQKAVWQIKELQKYADKVIIFIDNVKMIYLVR